MIPFCGTPRTFEAEHPEAALALGKSALTFVTQKGASLSQRTAPFNDWLQSRRLLGTWPYNRVMISPPCDMAVVADENLGTTYECINFGSQDYLGLARDCRVLESAKRIIDTYGVHSSGSPILGGRTIHAVQLEEKLARLLRHETAMLYATGWAAGFGVIAGLVRPQDTVAIDRLAHNCLAEGARHATANIKHFGHNDIQSLEDALAEARQVDRENGLFVVVESLYSMDSDSPDLKQILHLVRRHGAILIVDVAHDFGAMGRKGLGLLESLDSDWPDVIMGSFSKTFASNGGFVAAQKCVTDYLRVNASTMTFSNAISPIQTAIIQQAFDIAFSDEGSSLRERLHENINLLRTEMNMRGITVSGTPSPIVPVFVGDERIARLTSYHLTVQGLLANLVEFPAVARGSARFRFQVMATHQRRAIQRAAELLESSRNRAREELDAWSASHSKC